jgi:hypothetical protein
MAEEILEPQASEMLGQVAAHQSGELPGGAAPVEPVAEPVAAAPAEPAPAPAPAAEPAPTPFEVDGQLFSTEAEAFKFLKGQYGKVQTDAMLTEARLQGIQEAAQFSSMHAPATVEPVPEPAIDMDKFYEDPGKFLLERDAAIEQRLMGKVAEKQTAAQRDAEAWSTFTASYPELADFKSDVEAVAVSHGNEVKMLAAKDQKKAMDYVAFKVKEKFQKYAEVMKPTRVLSNTRVDAPAGSNQVVTPAQNVPNSSEGLDMISQMRNMRK